MAKPKITLEIEGTEEIGELIEKVHEQAHELENTVGKISTVLLTIEAKINQPPEK